MAINLKPLCWNWPAVTTGDTYPAAHITESDSDTDLASVRIKIKDADDVTVLTLTSADATITITTATAGAWDFTINEISAASTATLTPGFFSYDLETTDSAGTVSTEFSGTWQILTEITD